MIEILYTIIGFFIALFVVYIFSWEDYTLLRRNMSIEQMFNVAFLCFFSGLFTARIFFILFHWRFLYLNPLVFLLISYFPGLSLPGGILGSIVTVAIMSGRKIPGGRIFDVFSIAFLIGYVVDKLLLASTTFILKKNILVFDSIAFLLFFLLSIFFSLLFRTNNVKDGVIGGMMLVSFSLTTVIGDIINRKLFQSFLQTDSLYLVLFFIGLFVLISRSNSISARNREK